MMRIHIEQLPAGGLALEFEEPVQSFPALSELTAAGQCIFTTAVKTALRARRFGAMVQVKGTVATTVRMTCARCLKDFETPLSSGFEVTYTPRAAGGKEGRSAEEIELDAADMGLIDFDGEQIDLRDAIQEQVILALPIKALCTPTCKGLCPECGADLNQGECSCGHRAPEGAFAVLKNLKLGKK